MFRPKNNWIWARNKSPKSNHRSPYFPKVQTKVPRNAIQWVKRGSRFCPKERYRRLFSNSLLRRGGRSILPLFVSLNSHFVPFPPGLTLFMLLPSRCPFISTSTVPVIVFFIILSINVARSLDLTAKLVSWKHGGLGASGDSGGAFCVVDAGAAVSAAREQPGGGVQQHADQRGFHLGSHHHLLWPHHHFPHRYRRSHLHWLAYMHAIHLQHLHFSDPRACRGMHEWIVLWF